MDHGKGEHADLPYSRGSNNEGFSHHLPCERLFLSWKAFICVSTKDWRAVMPMAIGQNLTIRSNWSASDGKPQIIIQCFIAVYAFTANPECFAEFYLFFAWPVTRILSFDINIKGRMIFSSNLILCVCLWSLQNPPRNSLMHSHPLQHSNNSIRLSQFQMFSEIIQFFPFY